MLRVLKEKFINNREVRNASWLIAGQIVRMLIGFVISILTARYLGPSNYGIINYVAAYIAFFTSLCTLGINSVIIKDFVDKPDEQGEAIGTALCLRAISSFLSAIMIVAIISLVDRGEKTTFLVAVLSSIQLVFQVCDTFNYWFQSRYESKVTAIATFIAYTAALVYKVILLILGKSVVWFAFTSALDYLVLGILLFAFYKKSCGPGLKFSRVKAKELLSKSYHYILSGMMVAIYGQTDKLMLKHMLDELAVGYYALATTVNMMWVFVLQAIIDSLYPSIMRLHKEDKGAFEKKNRQLYAMVIYISVFVALCFTFFGKLIIRLLYGVEFLPAADSLQIVAWYTTFSFLGVARNAWIVCENKQKYLKYMYFSAAVCNIILNLIMIPIWGAPGAAAASLITQILTSMLIPTLIPDMRPNVRLMVDAFLLRGIR